MYLLASLPVPFSPEDIFQPLQNRCVEDAATCRRGDSKDGCGGGSPTLPGLLERGLLRALAAQGVPRCWVRLAWVCCRRAGLGSQSWGKRPCCSRVLTCLRIFFSPYRVQPQDPRGLRLQICDASQDAEASGESGRRFFLSSSHLTFIFYWHLGDLIIPLV